jgi:peptidoglycan hydrolase CwlO-like protein
MDRTRASLWLQVAIVALLGVIAFSDLSRPAATSGPQDYVTSQQASALNAKVDAVNVELDALSGKVDGLGSTLDAQKETLDKLSRSIDAGNDLLSDICLSARSMDRSLAKLAATVSWMALC